MAIEFTCPNGHALSAGDDKAGRTAKCPKCGAAVKIPGLSSASGRNLGLTEAAGSGAAIAAPPAAGMIVFLCPNGHRLNGPAKLQGRAGQCPHCGSKFRIPFQDPDEEEAYQAAQRDTAESGGAKGDQTVGEELSNEKIEEYSEGEASLEEYTSDPEVDLGLEGVEPDVPEEEEELAPAEPGWPTLFPYLWKQKSPGSEVDLYLSDGTKLTPQWFSPSWSLSEQGVFAVRDTEGAYTILSLAWDAIVRVEVRSVIDLPDGMFE